MGLTLHVTLFVVGREGILVSVVLTPQKGITLTKKLPLQLLGAKYMC